MLATRASWKLRAELARRCNSPRLSSGGDAARFIVRAILAVIHVIPRELRHLFPARSQVPKEEGSYLAHLHFLSSLGDAVPAVVAIDVFKGLVPGVADTPVYLHGPVRSFTAEPVCPVVAHGNLVRQSLLYLGMGHLVHLPGGLADQQAQHLALCGELDQGPLNRLIARQLLAEGLAHASIFHALLDAVDRGAEGARRLADSVLVHEGLRKRQPAFGWAENGAGRHPNLAKAHARVVGRHVECPEVFLHLHASTVRGHEKARDALCVAITAAGAAEEGAVRGDMHTGGPHLLAVDAPAGDTVPGLPHRPGLHVRGIGAMMQLGQAKSNRPRAIERTFDELGPLGRRPEIAEHHHERVVRDDGVLALLIVVQTEALGGEVLADHCHPEVRSVLAAELLRQREAKISGRIGAAPRLAHQLFPLGARQPAVVEIGAGPFAAVVEEALVVVLRLKRLDLSLDEAIELGEISRQLRRYVEIHVPYSSLFSAAAGVCSAPVAQR